MEPKGIRIALGHQARVGKDTLAGFIKCRLTEEKTHTMNFSAPIYKIAGITQAVLHKPNEKDPSLLQLIGTSMRGHYGVSVFIDDVARQIAEIDEKYPDHHIIVTDMRYKDEYEVLKRLGFTTVKILRENRVIDRDPNHISEIALCDAEFDYTIDNNSGITEFFNTADAFLSKFLTRT